MKLTFQPSRTEPPRRSDSRPSADHGAGGAPVRRPAAASGETPRSASPHAPGSCSSRKLKHLVVFTRQLHILVVSGSPLVDAMAALQKQVKDPAWRGVLDRLRTRVEEGQSLSQAMEEAPEYFDPVYRNLVAAGESSGQLAPVLDRLAGLARRRLHVRSAIMGAVLYPALLLCTAVVVICLLLFFVIPRFSQLFQTLDIPLPATTRVLVSLSEFLRSYWWAVLIGAGAVVAAVRAWVRSPGGRRTLDGMLIRLPYLGGIVQGFTIAWIARILGILLEGRVGVLDALKLTRQSVRNVHYMELIGRAEEAVTRGEPVSAAFAEADKISATLYEAMRNGEQSGRLGPLLTSVADFMDEDNEVIIKALTSILEPVILIVLGLLVGLVAASLFTPLFDMTAITEKGR